MRYVIEGVKDEIVVYINFFKFDQNKEYEKMINDVVQFVINWFNDDVEIWDDLKFVEFILVELEEMQEIVKVVDEEGVVKLFEEVVEIVIGEED